MKRLRVPVAPLARARRSEVRGVADRPFRPRAVLAPLGLCLALLGADARADDWPGWRGRDGRGVWSRRDVPARFDETTVRRRWRQPIGSGYAGIAIAGGRLVTLDFVADGESIADESGAPRAQSRHPQRDLPPEPGEERVICLDPQTGKTLWSHPYRVDYGDLSYASGPRSTPAIVKERVFTIGAMGKLLALDLATGKVRWERDALSELEPTLPTWGFAASPIVHGDLVIAMLGARPAGTVVAFDAETGRERWRALEDRPSYSTPILVPRKAGEKEPREHVLIVWTADRVVALDPRTGETHWHRPFRTSSFDVAIASPVVAGDVLLVSGYWDGAQTWTLAADRAAPPSELWKARDPSALMATPLFDARSFYVLDRRHGLIAIDRTSGERGASDERRLTATGRNPHASLVAIADPGAPEASDRRSAEAAATAAASSSTPSASDSRAPLRAVALNTEGQLVLLELSSESITERGRVELLAPTWAHPAFASDRVYARNDVEIVCFEVKRRGE